MESNKTKYPINGDFYQGIEHFACWLLDNAEGETITEELLRRWAVEAHEGKIKEASSKLQYKCQNCKFYKVDVSDLSYPYPWFYCSKGHWEGIDDISSESNNDPWADCQDFESEGTQ